MTIKIADQYHIPKQEKALGNFPRAFSDSACSVKIEQIFEFLIQCNTQNESQFSGRVKLPGFDRADRIAGYADQRSKLRLGQLFFAARLLQAVFQNQFVVHFHSTTLIT